MSGNGNKSKKKQKTKKSPVKPENQPVITKYQVTGNTPKRIHSTSSEDTSPIHQKKKEKKGTDTMDATGSIDFKVDNDIIKMITHTVEQNVSGRINEMAIRIDT